MSTAASTMQCTGMPSGPSEVQPPGKESEKPTTATGVTTASQPENSVHPPFLPSNEIEDDNAVLSRRVQNSVKLPECETAEPTTWPPGTHVLFLSSRGSDSGTIKIAQNSSRQFSFHFQSVNSLETYYEATKQFMSSAKSQKASEVLILHEIDVTADSQQPVMGGKILSENELCKPFYCRQDSKPIKLRVIYLLRPTESAEPPCSSTRQPVGAASRDEKWTAPNHASLCNSEVHSLVFDSDINWPQVRQAFDQHAVTSGKELTADDLIREIGKCCGAPLSRRMSGVPSADCVATAFGLDSVDASNHTTPLIPDVPVVEDESALNQLNFLQRQLSNECVETSSQPSSPDHFVSIVVGKYKKDKDSRTGFKEDIESFEKVAQCFGCSRENVHKLCPLDGYVTADQIQEFFNKLQERFKSESVSPRRVFLAVSAHGNEFGIRTSDEKEVPVGELLLPLASLGAFILLLYQACRGTRSHPAQAGENYQPAFVCSLGFASPETPGCVLPLQVPRAAAIFASLASYEAYRNELDGSWMPRALLDVVSRPGTVTVKQLAELVQARLHELKVCGVVLCRRRGKSCTAYIQTQYSANEGSENFAIETGLSSEADSQTPEAGPRAAADELAQLELNKPSQPD